MTTTSPARAQPTAASIAARRSTSTVTSPLAPEAISSTVASGAEHADHAAGRELSRRPQHVLERVGRVRVVDEDDERLPLVHLLHPSRNGRHGRETLGDRLIVDPEASSGSERSQRVQDVEASAQLQVDVRERVGPYVCVGREAERGDVLELVCEPPAVLVVDVDDGWDVRRKEPALRLEIALHGLVEVEMVLRQVRENEGVEAHAVEPMQ